MGQRTRKNALEEAWEPWERLRKWEEVDELLEARRLAEGLESEAEWWS